MYKQIKNIIVVLFVLLSIFVGTVSAFRADEPDITPQIPPSADGLSDKTIPSPGGPAETAVNAPQRLQTNSISPNATVPNIFVWYENNLSFGHLGNSIYWVNIFGNVSGVAQLNDIDLSYRVNGSGSYIPLTIGETTRRLASDGDFLIEIDYTTLNNGTNTVDIQAINTATTETTLKTVSFQYHAGNVWPMDYSVDWNTVSEIHDVAQVVDGEWTVMNDGTIRPFDVATGTTPVLDYDRIITFGDISWDNYEAEARVTINAIDNPAGFAAPSYGPGVGWMLRWRGHYQEQNEQPRTGWKQLGGLGWYRWSTANTAGLEMIGYSFGASYPAGGNVMATNGNIQLAYGVEHIFLMQVETTTAGDEYRFKAWPVTDPEPAEWQMVGLIDDANAPDSGSAAFVMHHVDASLGEVTFRPLDPNNPDPTNTPAPTATAVPSGETVTVTAVDDALVSSRRPNNLYGTRTDIQVDGAPELNSYVKFDVPALTGDVASATLRLYAETTDASGFEVYSVADSNWDESTITYANAPAFGSFITHAPSTTANAWVEVDVTGQVAGSGLVSFGLAKGEAQSIGFSAHEGSFAAELLLELAGEPGPTPTNTAVPTATNTPEATAIPTDTPMPTATNTPTAVPTNTSTPTATNTATATVEPTDAPTETPAPTETATLVPTATSTPTETPIPTETAVPTETPLPTETPDPTATPDAGTELFISDIDGVTGTNGWFWTAYITFTVQDNAGNPIAGAVVDGGWSVNALASCTTDSAGQCTVNKQDLRRWNSSVTFTVTNVTGSLPYNEALNADPDGDSDGTIITLIKP